MPRFYAARTASLVIALLGAVANFGLLLRLLSIPAIKLESESEWEGSSDQWRVNGGKLVWGLLVSYLAVSTTICSIGFYGIAKSKAALVRSYRDFSIADFSFSVLFTALCAYAAFQAPVRAGVCEELARQPELMRDMVEMGLNVENCELWVERAVLVFVGVSFILIVVRLHFLIAVSNFYNQLLRQTRHGLPLHALRTDDAAPQRVYLLPRSSPAPDAHADVLVYAPVPLSSLSPLEHASATEAWVSHHPHRHHRRHSAGTGRISLPVRPGEGLLPAPAYGTEDAKRS